MLLMIQRTLLLLLFTVIATSVWHTFKPLPQGLVYESPPISTDSVAFLYDLSYQLDGQRIRDQQIFSEAFRMIDSAESFIVLDLFLFNDDHPKAVSFDPLARELTDRLVDASLKRQVKVVLITDPINTFYGAYPNPYLEKLKEAGVEVAITDLAKLRDSNPIYSGFYRVVAAPFGVSKSGTLTNPFSTDSPKVSISAMLRMLNFKANHRKLIITENGVLVTSANPHDASSNHSNIALYTRGPGLVQAALEAEQAVLNLSGSDLDITALTPASQNPDAGRYTVQLLTESRILSHMQESIRSTGPGDRIDIGVFYLSHRGLIQDLTTAAKRGAHIRIVLDANKDAFGRQKNGIPNRQTAQELVNQGDGNIQVRWYLTQGEQFHSKLLKVTTPQLATLFGGSCNFTRRNFADLNLEANLMVSGPPEADVFAEADRWFSRIWSNKDGTYTGDLSLYEEKSLVKGLIYRIMEGTGLSTF